MYVCVCVSVVCEHMTVDKMLMYKTSLRDKTITIIVN